jgi:predicted phosphodiesterase
MSTPNNQLVKQVFEALEKTYQKAVSQLPQNGEQNFDLQKDRLIIFSDHHKGARNGADDFIPAEKAYHAALAYYYRMGHTLVTLGDVEELWEERIPAVLKNYAYTFNLEAKFHRRQRYLRLWGNHDDDWQYPDMVKKYLDPVYGGEPLKVWESMRLLVQDGERQLGEFFLTHGHQGTYESDRFAGLSKFFVRHVWRPFQRLTGISLNTPAEDWNLRKDLNRAMYSWASTKSRLVLIVGHTHQPVFESKSHLAQLKESMQEILEQFKVDPTNRELQEKISELAAELEWMRIKEPDEKDQPKYNRPCFFNTGCCSFSDGDITGLELINGEIRLIRFPDQEGKPRPVVLARKSLRHVFSACP